MTPAGRVVTGVLAVVQLVLLGLALNDLRRRSPDEVKGPRWMWALISLVNIVGPITYFTVGRTRATPIEQD